MASVGTVDYLSRLEKRVKALENWKRKASKIMSDLSKQQDRLDADIPKLQQEETDEAAQIVADKASLDAAQKALDDMKAQRDALQSSDAAAAARLTSQIDALEKLLPQTPAPAPAPSPAPAPAPAPQPSPSPAPVVDPGLPTNPLKPA
jgi:septal ring factor EnvC (AmiA/AmiB activator)